MNNSTALDPLYLQWEAEFESYEVFMLQKSLQTSWITHLLKYVQSVYFVLILIVNVIAIVAIGKFSYLNQKPANVLVLSLSVADGCMGECLCLRRKDVEKGSANMKSKTFLLFLSFIAGLKFITTMLHYYLPGTDIYSEFACIAHVFFGLLSGYGNVLHIFCISVERCICLYFPLQSIAWITVSNMRKVSETGRKRWVSMSIFHLLLTSQEAFQAAISMWIFVVGKISLELAFCGAYQRKPYADCTERGFLFQTCITINFLLIIIFAVASFVVYIMIGLKVFRSSHGE